MVRAALQAGSCPPLLGLGDKPHSGPPGLGPRESLPSTERQPPVPEPGCRAGAAAEGSRETPEPPQGAEGPQKR